ncbi:tRNA (adenosine(37)-N6)-dimethylallyltransferase MiaA [Kiloniella litopenaei]|uniref:tRNA (adenosine(37)-N6)-dimethylallyltransferase MiaA n=1 Tax=Kiloniella litopenaei TaxID=1549748 RepID=UPI003BA8DAB2
MSEIIYILTGPTAVGKTALALDWAAQNEAEILSCDSLLVYQGMDIGTAKPTAEELSRVPHHGIDCFPASQQCHIGAYVDLALRAVEDIFARGKAVLVTGGSGFYLKSFFEPVFDEIQVPEFVKKQVKSLSQKDPEALLEALESLNPEGLETLDTQNPRRVLRALERCLATGKTLTALKEEFAQKSSVFAPYTKKTCLLARDPEALRQRARERVDKMLEAGLVDEVKALKAAGFEANPSASQAIGYRETLAWLETEEPLDALAQAIAQNTNELLRKQRIWFRKQIPIDQTLDLDIETDPLGKLFSST